MFEQITEYVTGSPWTYGVVLGGLLVYLVIPAAALDAFAGDNISYFFGDRVGDPACRRLFRGDKGRKRLRWARAMLDRHGALAVTLAIEGWRRVKPRP